KLHKRRKRIFEKLVKETWIQGRNILGGKMQNLKREKDRLSVENDSLREVNVILNRKMMEIAEEIKANGVKFEENRKKIERIEKILKVKMRKNK
ncbi:hypothetical protein, partial [Leptotrichia massiliensis]